jgi:hypothetical protein
MAIDSERFPEGSTPEDKQRIRLAALELLERDRHLDDAVYTPPGAIGAHVERIVVAGVQATVRERKKIPKFEDLSAEEQQRVRVAALDMLEWDKEASELLGRLGKAGWIMAGADSLHMREVNYAFALPEQLAHRGETVFLDLPIRDDEGELLTGFEFCMDEETGEPGLSYVGPIDDTFRAVVDAMVEVTQPPKPES